MLLFLWIILIGIASPALQAEELGSGWWHGRYVNYKIRNGKAIYQGDIVLGFARDIPKVRPDPSVSKLRDRQGTLLVGLNGAYLWPKGVVPYTFAPGLPQRVITAIRSAITLFTNNTPLRWVQRTNEADYVVFQMLTADDGSCGSSDSIGVYGGEQHIDLPNDTDCLAGGVTVHEMGHAIGMEHEQTRTDRDYYINVKYDSIDKNDFEQYDTTPGQIDVLAYDQSSIMHYSIEDYSRRNGGGNTIDTIPLGIPVSHRNNLSAADIESIRTMYGEPSATTTIYTNPPSLKVIVDGTAVTTPMTFEWAAGSRHTLDIPAGPQTRAADPDSRYVFARWGNDGEKSQTIVAGRRLRVIGANFSEQVQLQVGVARAGGGKVTVDPASEDGWYAIGTTVTITATPNAGFRFLRWDDPSTVDNRQGLSASAMTLTIDYPWYSYIADFTNAPITRIDTNIPGTNAIVDGTEYTLPVNFAWAANSTHRLNVTTPMQNIGYDSSPYRYTFQNWSSGPGRFLTITASATGGTIMSTWMQEFLVSTYTADPSDFYYSGNGTITVSPASKDCGHPTDTDCYYEAGTTLTLKAAGVGAFEFTGWSRDLSGRNATESLEVNDQILVRANFLQPARLLPRNFRSSANGANLGVAPGEMVTITGFQFGGPEEAQLAELTGSGYPTTVAQTRVLFDGVAAPILSVQADEIRVIVPYNVSGRTTTRVQVELRGRVGNAANVPVAAAQPGLMTLDGSGAGLVVAVNEDSSDNSGDRPAPKGSVVTLTGTGEGLTKPAGAAGRVNDADSEPVLPVQVIIAGREANVVSFGGVAGHPAGTFQAKVVVPDDCPSGLVPVFVTVGSFVSPGNTRIAVQ